MSQKLNCILLIDDDESICYLNERIIKKTNCTKKILSFQSGVAALDFLKSNDGTLTTKIDLILLDINMPLMNGWEFLEEYRNLDLSLREGNIVAMLTTSQNPDDEERAKSIDCVKNFCIKMLTVEKLNKIIESNFN